MRASWRLLVCVLVVLPIGCMRDDPPEIPRFRPPVKPVVEEVADTEPAAEVPEPPPKAPPPEASPPVKVVAAAPPPPPPKEEAKATTPQAPSIVGSWRVVEMARNGQARPMPEGMSMVMTFGADGTIAMAMNVPNGQQQNQQGTYTLSGAQISITMEKDTKTANLTFEGNNNATLDVPGEVTMKLQRS